MTTTPKKLLEAAKGMPMRLAKAGAHLRQHKKNQVRPVTVPKRRPGSLLSTAMQLPQPAQTLKAAPQGLQTGVNAMLTPPVEEIDAPRTDAKI